MKLKYLQDGGQMAPEEQGGAPAPETAAPEQGGAPAQGGGSPEEAIMQVAAQLVESLMQQVQDPAIVAQILQAALQLLQQAAAPQQPTFQRRGGKVYLKK